MTAKTIFLGQSKGGCSKTLSSCITSYLLSQKGYKVLHIDADHQANSSQLLAQIEDPVEAFGDHTLLEAILEKDASPHIHRITDNLHLLPSSEYLSTLDRLLMTDYSGNPSLGLKTALEPVKEQYDVIVCDTAPSLALPTINVMCASDYAIVMFEPSRFCMAALPRYIRTLNEAKAEGYANVEVAGILRTLTHARRNDSKELVEIVAEDYPGLCFETVISRRASTGRLPIFGFFDNSEVEEAVSQYQSFITEVIQRCQITQINEVSETK